MVILMGSEAETPPSLTALPLSSSARVPWRHRKFPGSCSVVPAHVSHEKEGGEENSPESRRMWPDGAQLPG